VLLAEWSQNKSVKVSGQAMQNVLVQTEQHPAAYGTADKNVRWSHGAQPICSDLGKTHEINDMVSRACDSIIVLNQEEIDTWLALLSANGSLFARMDAGTS
jgi:hypothetical protein